MTISKRGARESAFFFAKSFTRAAQALANTSADASIICMPAKNSQPGKRSKKQPSLSPELEKLQPFNWRALDTRPVIGIDEVGRGCLAGPVCAAAVILADDHRILDLTDSKLLTEVARERIAESIREGARVGIGTASVEEIDRINILQASFLAMKRAMISLLSQEENLKRGGYVLVDGNQPIPGLGGRWMQKTLVKGDLIAEPISAASIVAKVFRDRLMREWHEDFPNFGFNENKGYASEGHREAILRHGPCWLHRKSFSGVREHWSENLDIERSLALGGDKGRPGPLPSFL